MILGHFDLTLKSAVGLDDTVFIEAQKNGSLQQLLDGLHTDAEYHTDNLVTDAIVPYTGFLLFGATGVGEIVNFNTSSAFFGSVCLLTTDSEPTYMDWDHVNNEFVSPSNVSGSANTSSGGKVFEEEASEAADIRSDPGGREAVWYRERWLYLPSQAASTNIRSIAVAAVRSATNTGSDYRINRMARVRIKDAGGNPIIVAKTTSQVLLLEYKAIFVSI